MVSHCGFNFIFLIMMLNIFMCLIVIHISFFVWYLGQVFCLFFFLTWDDFLCNIELLKYSRYLWYNFSSDIWFLIIFYYIVASCFFIHNLPVSNFYSGILDHVYLMWFCTAFSLNLLFSYLFFFLSLFYFFVYLFICSYCLPLIPFTLFWTN